MNEQGIRIQARCAVCELPLVTTDGEYFTHDCYCLYSAPSVAGQYPAEPSAEGSGSAMVGAGSVSLCEKLRRWQNGEASVLAEGQSISRICGEAADHIEVLEAELLKAATQLVRNAGLLLDHARRHHEAEVNASATHE